MLDLIKKYWDLLSGAICGIVSSILVSFKLEEIQLIYSIIILMLVFIGLFKVVRACLESRKSNRKDLLVDKIVESQNHMKAISIAQNPTKTGEELGELLIQTTKGGKITMKKLFVWIKDYWHQIIGLIGAFVYATYTVYLYCTDNFGFILSWLPEEQTWQIVGKVGFGVISTILVFFMVRNQVKWVGIGSVETAKKYLDQLSNGTVSKLSPTAKSEIKAHLKFLNKKLKNAEITLANYEDEIKDLTKKIQSTKELLSLGLGTQDAYAELVKQGNSKNQLYEETKQNISLLKSEIEKYENAIK